MFCDKSHSNKRITILEWLCQPIFTILLDIFLHISFEVIPNIRYNEYLVTD
jgi:hypothetical protein